MNKQYNKRIYGLDEDPKAEIHIDLLKTTLKNIELENPRPWWAIWILVRDIYLHSRQTSTRNEQMPKRSTSTRMDDQMLDHIDPEVYPQENHPRQLQTQNLPTNDVENNKSA